MRWSPSAVLLFACTGTVPTPRDTAVGTPPPDCSAYEYRYTIYDCRQVDQCDESPSNLEYRLACCECDPALCGEADPLVCTLPPPFPADTGPALAFDIPLIGFVGSSGSVSRILVAPTADGSSILALEGDPIRAVSVPCVRTGNVLDCGAPTVSSFQFTVFQLLLLDSSGDGVADHADLRAGGRAPSGLLTVQVPPVGFVSYTTLRPDLDAGSFSLPSLVLPTETVRVYLPEPGIPVEGAVDGAGTIWPLLPVVGDAGVAEAFEFEGSFPWGSEVAVTAVPTDLSGNPFTVPSAAQVVADPGPWTQNPGFDDPVGGWAHDERSSMGPACSQPYAGDGCAWLPVVGTFVTTLQVPPGQPSLAFVYRVDRPWTPEFTAGISIVEADGTRTPIWSLPPLPVDAGFPVIPWSEASADLTAWAGQEVLLDLRTTLPAEAFQYANVYPSAAYVGVSVDSVELR